MADLERLFQAIEGHDLYDTSFDEGQRARLNEARRAGTVEELLRHDRRIRAGVTATLLLPPICEELRGARDALLQLVGSLASPLGPGVSARWGQEEEIRFVTETIDKIWEFKRAIDLARIEAHRRLTLIKKSRGAVTLKVYQSIMRPLLDLVNRAMKEIEARSVLVQRAKAPGSEEERDLRHDFNDSPVAIIIGYNSMIESNIAEGIEADFSWLLPPRNLGSLLNIARHFGISLKQEKGVQVEVEIPEELKNLRLKNAEHIEDLLRIITNLATNAVKYINPALPAAERFVRVQAEIIDTWLTIFFEDNGRGMSREFVEKNYGQIGMRAPEVVESSIPGTGTGASSVKKITQSLGGAVQVESELEKGTTVRVSLPSTLFEETESGGGEVPTGEDAETEPSAEEVLDGTAEGKEPGHEASGSKLLTGVSVPGLAVVSHPGVVVSRPALVLRVMK